MTSNGHHRNLEHYWKTDLRWEGIIRQSPETGPKLREFFSKAK